MFPDPIRKILINRIRENLHNLSVKTEEIDQSAIKLFEVFNPEEDTVNDE